VWKLLPLKSLIPRMPGSFGRLSGPDAMTSMRGRMSSPWRVAMRQRFSEASQRSASTMVLNSARS
jgi:hypothetical protein